LLGNGNPNISLGENRNHISGLQFEVLGRIVLQDQLAQIKRNQNSLQCDLIEPLNYGIIPVNLGCNRANLRSRSAKSEPGRAGILRACQGRTTGAYRCGLGRILL
jgi:hypothetical protein